jgi:hypothetical protein
MRPSRILAGMLLFAALSTGHCAQREHVCAKYSTRSGWSDPYTVDATVMDGSELNDKTGSFNYNFISKYVVIFWHPGQASVIEMDMPFLSAIGATGHDQTGREWEIATRSPYSSACW